MTDVRTYPNDPSSQRRREIVDVLALRDNPTADDVAQAYAGKRAELHGSSAESEQCALIRRAQDDFELAAWQMWPRRPTVYDLLGLTMASADYLLRPALDGRLFDLRETEPNCAAEQVAWCMSHGDFNALWTASHGAIERELVLSRLNEFGSHPPGTAAHEPPNLLRVAVVWAYLVLSGESPRHRLDQVGTPTLTDPQPMNHHPRASQPGFVSAPPPAPSMSDRTRELFGGVAWNSDMPASWREMAPTADVHQPGLHRPVGTATVAGDASRRRLSLSPLASVGVAAKVSVVELSVLHGGSANPYGGPGQLCEELDRAFCIAMARLNG